MAKRKKSASFTEKMRLLRKAGLEDFIIRRPASFEDAPLDPLPERMKRILDYLKKYRSKNKEDMFCFIMYDITDDRIRNYIAKYLLEKGCIRIQKSVYMACLDKALYQDIHRTLKEVNDMYDNEDSIIFVPIDEFHVEDMKMVGKNIDLSLVVDLPSTLFF